MIAASRSLKVMAFAGAIILHAALAMALMREEPVLVEGSGSQGAQLGNSFADMVAGTLTSEDSSEVIEPESQSEAVTEAEPEELTTPQPEPLPEQDLAEPVEQPEPVEVDQQPPTEIANAQPAVETSDTDPQVTEVQVDVAALAVPEVPEGVLPVRPEVLEPTPIVPEALAALPEVVQPLAAARVVPEDRIDVLDPDSTVPKLSKRPVRREPSLETLEPVRKAAPKPAPARKVAAKPEPQKTNRGKNTQNAKAGTTRGTADKASSRQGSGTAKSKKAGNAAVSNYSGLVNRHLARIRKPSLNRRGVVRVSFSIALSGGLAGVSVARSSGSSKLDQAAASMIRRAAPFPKPPAGARRSFTISIEFR